MVNLESLHTYLCSLPRFETMIHVFCFLSTDIKCYNRENGILNDILTCDEVQHEHLLKENIS